MNETCKTCSLPLGWSGWCPYGAHETRYDPWPFEAITEALFGWLVDILEEQEAASILRLLRVGAIDLKRDLSPWFGGPAVAERLLRGAPGNS